MKTIYKKFSLQIICSMLFGTLLILGACTDKIDDSNLYTSKLPTIIEELEKPENADKYSSYVQLLKRVKLNNIANASTLNATLNNRGNYTCFAPTNEAIKIFVDSVTNTPDFKLEELADSIAEYITKNSIIDNGDDRAYRLAEFPTPGSFSIENLEGRLLSSKLDSVTGKYVINSTAMIISSDKEVLNGIIHTVDHVIAPSTNTVGEMLIYNPNMSIMAELIRITGWVDSLNRHRDKAYEEVERPLIGSTAVSAGTPAWIPRVHNYGFTAFIEPDSILHKVWGIPMPVKGKNSNKIENWEDIQEKLTNKLKSENLYPEATSEDVRDKNNVLNQFVAYHLIRGSYPYNKFVRHFNEFGYKYGDAKNPQTKDYSVDVWSYQTTLGTPARLLKITQVAGTGSDTIGVYQNDKHKLFINRWSIYNNERSGDYKVKEIKSRGIQILEHQGTDDNNALNGYVYAIDQPLAFDNNAGNALNERMRIDFCYIFPEVFSNNLRGIAKYFYFPKGYLANVADVTAETEVLYLDAPGSRQGYGGWRDYEGDEFMLLGLFDITIKIPPVPKDGDYEIRLGTSNNTLRGMAQIYFGENPHSLVAAGLPIDMRQTGRIGNEPNPAIPWIEDTEDDYVDLSNDRRLRDKDYMKAPQYFTVTDGNGKTPVRSKDAVLRFIIGQYSLKHDKTYYVRFKSALNKTDAQFFLDYIEIVPKSVYASVEGEDIW